jgi:choline-sulfatase
MHFGGKDQMQGFQYRPYGDFRHGLGHQAEPLSLFPGYNAQESAGVCEIPESLNHDVVVIRETLAFVLEHRAAQPEKPWFACASFTRPHSPFTAPGRFFRRYEGKVFAEPLPKNPEAEYDPYTLKLARKSWQIESTQEANDRGLQGYYAALDFVDDCIGELLRGLEQSGALDNTIVIYTSDHGEVCGRHGYFGKGIHFEESIRVPLLIRLPKGSRRKRLFNRPVSLMDLFPTACGLAGLPVPKGLDGIDLSAWIRSGRQTSWPRTTVSSMYCQWGARINYTAAAQDTTPHAAFRTVRWRDWKYVAIQGAAPLLFDLRTDPLERKNLAAEPRHANLLRKLEAMTFAGYSWKKYQSQLRRDRKRMPKYASGKRPTTPNQYQLSDGRIFDAEASLYEQRFLAVPPHMTGGIIPQQVF